MRAELQALMLVARSESTRAELQVLMSVESQA
jgi:hypothetical protein